MTTIGNFIERVLRINDPETAKRFFDLEVAYLRKNHPEVTDPAMVVRANIGWCFGEGMRQPVRKMWATVCGAEHPAGPDYADRDFTPDEMFRVGQNIARGQLRGRPYPSAWDLILRERFDD